MSDHLDDWFAREILVHEGALTRYLFRTWPHSDDVHGLRQEVYVRVYQAARKSRPATPKSFMFATARNLMADRVRRARIVSIEAVGDIEALNVLIEKDTPERQMSSRQELRRLAEAFDRLPDRCREIFWLCRVEQRPQKEVAARLGISRKAVEKQVAKGIRRIAEYFFGNHLDTKRGASHTQHEDGHGQQTD